MPEFDPASMQTYIKDSKELEAIQERVLRNQQRSSVESLENYKKIIDYLQESVGKGTDLDSILAEISVNFGKAADELEPMLYKLIDIESKGGNINAAIEQMKNRFEGVTVQLKKTSELSDEVLKSVEKIAGTDVTKLFTKSKEGFESILDGVKNLAGGGGFTGIFKGLELIREATEPIRHGWSDMNRYTLDINAALGRIGELHDDWGEKLGDIAGKYSMANKDVAKVTNHLAEIGVQHDDLIDQTDRILANYKEWSDLTPEKQIEMMGTYMHDFGLTTKEAGNAMHALFQSSEETVKRLQLSNVSSKEFREHAYALEVSMRNMGYNVGDAASQLAGVVEVIKSATGAVDLQAAERITKGIMGLGATDMGQQAYMMQRFGGVRGGAMEAAGAFVMGEGRSQAQAGLLQELLGAAGVPKGVTAAAGTEEFRQQQYKVAGALELVSQKFGLGFTQEDIQQIAKKGPEGITKMLDEMKKASDHAAKERITNQKSGENIAKSEKHLEEILGATRTFEEWTKGEVSKIGGYLAHIANFFGYRSEAEKEKKEQEQHIQRSAQEQRAIQQNIMAMSGYESETDPRMRRAMERRYGGIEGEEVEVFEGGHSKGRVSMKAASAMIAQHIAGMTFEIVAKPTPGAPVDQYKGTSSTIIPQTVH